MKKIFLLAVASILAFQMNMAKAEDTATSSSSDQEKSEGCVLEE